MNEWTSGNSVHDILCRVPSLVLFVPTCSTVRTTYVLSKMTLHHNVVCSTKGWGILERNITQGCRFISIKRTAEISKMRMEKMKTTRTSTPTTVCDRWWEMMKICLPRTNDKCLWQNPYLETKYRIWAGTPAWREPHTQTCYGDVLIKMGIFHDCNNSQSWNWHRFSKVFKWHVVHY